MKRTLLLSALLLIMTLTYAQDLKKSAQEHFNEENWEGAIKDYKKYLKKNQKDSSAWYALGGTYAKAELYDKAIESFDKSKETNFSIFFVTYSKATNYVKMGDNEKALESLQARVVALER